ncbi:MAG: Mu-like prophage major head subunit gpT family protein [Myxococcota bacterium]
MAEGILHHERIIKSNDPEAIRLGGGPFPLKAQRCAEVDGIRIDSGMPYQIAQRAVSSATLGNVVALVSQRALTAGYEEEPRTFLAVFRETTADNFRDIHRVKFSDAPKLELVAEGDPYTEGTLSDGRETLRLATYGKNITFTRQMIVNDDISAITRVPQMMGAAAAVTESDVAWDVVVSNPVLSDGTPVFDASRNNVAYSTPLDAAALSAARAYFRTAQTENGASMNLMPRYLVVGQDLETTAEKLIRTPTDFAGHATLGASLSESIRNSLELIVEPRIPANEFYLFADTNRVDTCEYAWLTGSDGPVVERERDFSTKGMRFSVTDDFGAGVVDFRGMYKGTAAAAP